VARVRGSADRIAAMPGVAAFSSLDGEVRCQVDSDNLDDVLTALAALGVESLVAHPPTLEELFLRQYDEGAPV
jgi:ABC-2 type transport system ATP-binding protein